MRNLKHYSESSSDFLDKVIQSKRAKKNDITPPYKERITTLSSRIKEHFEEYEDCFERNNLENLTPRHSYNSEEEKDIKELYSYSSTHFKQLRKNILTLDGNRQLDTCQYCTIDSISSFDHIAPQSIFPQFSAHPKNLFPACSICNTKKGNAWLNQNSELHVLNLYLDILPETQYLFVKITKEDDSFSVSFFLENRNNICPELFQKIENHYTTLNLLERFSHKASGIISEFETTIKNFLKDSLTLEDIIQTLSQITADKSRITGLNHYKNVIELELCNNYEFKKFISSKYLTTNRTTP